MTRAALYARVSTSEEAELQDPETQLIILRDYAQARGYDGVRAWLAYRFNIELEWFNIERSSSPAF